MEVYMAKNTKTKVKKNQVVEKKVTSKKILFWIFLAPEANALIMP